MAKENKSPVSKKVEDIKPEDKRKALETALTQIKKQFGEGAVMRLGQNNGHARGAISSGSLSLDLALGIGGLPRGRILRSTGRNPQVRPPWRSTASPKAKNGRQRGVYRRGART